MTTAFAIFYLMVGLGAGLAMTGTKNNNGFVNLAKTYLLFILVTIVWPFFFGFFITKKLIG
jgi:hypothetical protein